MPIDEPNEPGGADQLERPPFGAAIGAVVVLGFAVALAYATTRKRCEDGGPA